MKFKILSIFIFMLLSCVTNAANFTLALPEVNYEYWNAPDINLSNNCYNYATNRAEGSWAQPGDASHAKYTAMSCESIYAAASQDWGLVPTKYFSIQENKEDTLIALVVHPGTDFHWYRRGSNNKWSHKLNFQVFETDNSGRIIDDPITANRGLYSDFCGYFKVKNYLSDSKHQNGGYVRIGKMTDWPQNSVHTVENFLEINPLNIKKNELLTVNLVGKSKVILQIFSGKENPKFFLQQILKDPVAARMLSEVGKAVQDATAASERKSRNFQNDARNFRSTLGESSIFILDSEGLIFPQGCVIELKDTSIKVTFKNGDAVILKSSIADDLQHYLMNLNIKP